MKKVITNTKANKYGFVKNDVVFELNEGLNTNGKGGQYLIDLMSQILHNTDRQLIQGWELATTVDGSIEALSIYGENVNTIVCRAIADMLNNTYKGKKLLVKGFYQLI